MRENTMLVMRSLVVTLVSFLCVPRGYAQEPPVGAPATEAASSAFDQAATIARLRQSIAGKENAPSGEVWKNIQTHKAVPAGRLLAMMEFGYSRSLGVDCRHCHDVARFDSDDKMEKKTARAMSDMVRELNGKTLPSIAGLESEKPTVNCTTCHRGEIKPALDLK